MSSEKKTMRRFDNLDSSEIHCPCGAVLYIDGWMENREIDAWMNEHKPHCNGKMSEFITDDGMRCLSDNHPRSREYDL